MAASKAVVVLLLLTFTNATPQLHQQERDNSQHLDPVNDSDIQNEEKLHQKRTLFGVGPYTYAARYGAAKHVGIHPMGFKYILGYGPIGLVPVAKPVTLLKPILHTHGWKPIIPVLKQYHFKPAVPVVSVHVPHQHVHHPIHHHIQKPVVPVQETVVDHHHHVVPEHHHHLPEHHHHVVPEHHHHVVPDHHHHVLLEHHHHHVVQTAHPVQPVVPVKPLVPVQPATPFLYPFQAHFLKQFLQFHNPLVPVQPHVHPVVPHVHPVVPQPPLVQHLLPQGPPHVPVQHPVVQPLVPHLPVAQPLVPQIPVAQPVVPQIPFQYHFFKQFPQVPFYKQITPLFPVPPVPAVPELPKAPLPPVTIHSPGVTHDTRVSVQIPAHLPEHPHFRPMVNFIPQAPVQPETSEHGFHDQVPIHFPQPQPQPDFHHEQHGHADHPVVFQHQQPQAPTHPAPQIPLYLPPHPVFRPNVAQPVGPFEPTNSVQTELSGTFPKHPFPGNPRPFQPGIHHPSITLEPPYN